MQQTNQDYAAFRNGVCVAVASVMQGPGSKGWEREFYQVNAGCEIKILPREEAGAALLAALKASAR